MLLEKALATALGIGYINNGKGAGTIAAVATCIVWYCEPTGLVIWQWLWVAFIFIIGCWSASVVEKCWGIDNSKVVIDEVAGMLVALLLIPVKLPYVIIALILFRFFDIVKPLGIRSLEKLPSGLGVMADDVLAGVYANIILQLVVGSKLL
jgi:phosphatidylglycerophosphatase A